MSEALTRGHHVTGVVGTENQRNKLPAEANYCVAGISDPRQLTQVVEGQDLLISAARPWKTDRHLSSWLGHSCHG
ncbi:NAD(P)H-binding protein [Halomonas sp. GT]|uniref:NAD(P)H-binding protein n=1 Tax=Halomonas sp. GT TaxID=1971364 RepID=UPI001E4C54B1|nr:NAD(P)H-binding protein [Halomonas sp. GT]